MSVYGYCPECGKPGMIRERRLDGFTFCDSGHKWLAAEQNMITSKLTFERALISIEEICMLYDPNGNNAALESIAEICDKAFNGRRR